MSYVHEATISEDLELLTQLEDLAFAQLIKPRRRHRLDDTPWHMQWKGKRIFRKKSSHHSHVPTTH